MQIDEYSAIQLIRYVQMNLRCIFVSQYCIIQDRNRLRNEFIGLKLNDVIIKEREKLEQKNGGMDASDLQVGLISSHNTAFYTSRNMIFWFVYCLHLQMINCFRFNLMCLMSSVKVMNHKHIPP